MKLYEIQEQLAQIDNVLEQATDPETQQILLDSREQVMQVAGGKIENILDFASDCKAKSDYLANEIKRLQAKKKSVENKIAFLNRMVFDFMKQNGVQKADYGTYTCTVAKTPAKVVIDEANMRFLPEKYLKVSYEPVKDLIKQDMVDGVFKVKVDDQDVEIAHLESGETLRIK